MGCYGLPFGARRSEYDRAALHHLSEEAKDLLANMLEKDPCCEIEPCAATWFGISKLQIMKSRKVSEGSRCQPRCFISSRVSESEARLILDWSRFDIYIPCLTGLWMSNRMLPSGCRLKSAWPIPGCLARKKMVQNSAFSPRGLP